ncbi:MAG: actin-related 7-like [Trebouxia sp. A1-2]|nr:MAG: actin-related 7-like [Trebouxia sp. A1-2]
MQATSRAADQCAEQPKHQISTSRLAATEDPCCVGRQEQLTQLAFEEFNMTGFFLCDQPVLSLYSVGKITGTVVDLDISVIAEGQVNYHSTKRLLYGGADLDKLMASLLEQRGVKCGDPQRLKELCARASSPLSSSEDAAAGEVHTLPDGQSITIQGEGQQLAQALLNPSLLGKDLSDLPSATVTQIMQHPDGPTRKVFIAYWTLLTLNILGVGCYCQDIVGVNICLQGLQPA